MVTALYFPREEESPGDGDQERQLEAGDSELGRVSICAGPILRNLDAYLPDGPFGNLECRAPTFDGISCGDLDDSPLDRVA